MAALDVVVRPLAPTDRAAWDRVWDTYLTFYEEPRLEPGVHEYVFARLADPTDDRMRGFVAVDADGRVVGLANVVVHPNTWSDVDDGYLEDLAVHPDVRGRGVGRALLAAVVAHGEAHGWRRVHWHTERTNERARALYDQVGELTAYVRYVRGTGKG